MFSLAFGVVRMRKRVKGINLDQGSDLAEMKLKNCGGDFSHRLLNLRLKLVWSWR